MNLKQIGYISLAGILGLLIGRFILQSKPNVQIKEVTKTVEVIKEVKVENKNIKTVTTEKVNKDGSKEIITVTEDKSSSKLEMTDSRKTVVDKTTKIKNKSLTLALLGVKDLGNFSRRFEYAATVTAPIYGNLKVQGLVTTDKRVGLGLALDI